MVFFQINYDGTGCAILVLPMFLLWRQTRGTCRRIVIQFFLIQLI
jgi:hypothetical protein